MIFSLKGECPGFSEKTSGKRKDTPNNIYETKNAYYDSMRVICRAANFSWLLYIFEAPTPFIIVPANGWRICAAGEIRRRHSFIERDIA
jgi:hypothetical protein